MKDLSPTDFETFFEAIHHHGPFPWQSELLGRVAEEGRWPALLDLPTGTGKTAALDVAVFAQALEATKPPAERRCPRRTVLVVDRRTVVDQAYERGLKIQCALDNATDPVLENVAARLRQLAGNDDREGAALGVHLLRGGIPRDETWAHDPTQPLIAVSTIDQVGSRLLFRGYGVSSGMRPLHAGLLANDVLFLLDEVHLATAFKETLHALGDRFRRFKANGLPDRWQVVEMSATPGSQPERRFSLGEADRKHPVLRRRLGASKRTKLVAVSKSGRDALSKEMAEAVTERAFNGKAIAVVVNRVETARQIHALLSKKLESVGIVPELVTGRMRPFDRDDLGRKLLALVGSGRDRRAAETSVVVATQCIEAGADFDFDLLFTECASLDALRQRFGRLDRLGASADAHSVDSSTAGTEGSAPEDLHRGFIFVRESDLKPDQPDPIYGQALRKTWEYLAGIEELDFGIEAFQAPSAVLLLELLAPLETAPILLPGHMDAWAQTSPQPYADPDPALWLHGKRQKDLDVSLIWRADLDELTLQEAGREGSRVRDRLAQRLEACPPRTMEALQLPISALLHWLASEKPPEMSDAGTLPAEESKTRTDKRPALIWRGNEIVLLGDKGKRRPKPGDTIIVPSDYGGLRNKNWDPDAKEAVADLGDRAQLEQKGKAVLRLHPQVLQLALGSDTAPEVPRPSDPEDEDTDDNELVAECLVRLGEGNGWAADIAGLLAKEYEDARREDTIRASAAPRLIAVATTPGDPAPTNSSTADHNLWIVQGRRRYQQRRNTGGLDLGSESEQSSLTGFESRLDEHLAGVGDYARTFAHELGLPSGLVSALETAGRWHDAGKADPRFQQWLHGGSSFKTLNAEYLLAKSALPSQDRAKRDRARERSGYPKGARHELLSLAMMQSLSGSLTGEGDWDLVLHLVASHHGYCRPLAPYVQDDDPQVVEVTVDRQAASANTAHGLERIDSGVIDRFWRLTRRYGWYGLAWLEAILRLADHRRSEFESAQQTARSEKQHAA